VKVDSIEYGSVLSEYDIEKARKALLDQYASEFVDNYEQLKIDLVEQLQANLGEIANGNKERIAAAYAIITEMQPLCKVRCASCSFLNFCIINVWSLSVITIYLFLYFYWISA